MNYISTRGRAPVLGFEDVLLAGLARDGGLYVPETWPVMPADRIASLAGRPFADVAVEVILPFTGGCLTRAELAAMAEAAYASFGHPAVTPLTQIDRRTFVLELFHGPTLAFKDVAMQLLARMMDHVLAKRGRRATIVGATSGDTGGAAIEAFRSSQRVDVVILFPDGRVSDVQRRMMTTPTEKSVHAVAIKGTFDDCQALVKAMFNDHPFRDRVNLSGVNSINWGRIVAQVTYYFVAAVALGAPHRRIAFCVPTGNFGDIFAGYVARRMGLPIEMLVIGSNQNDILPRALETGVYEISNRDASLVARQMQMLAQGGRFELTAEQAAAVRQDFGAGAAGEQDVATTIRDTLAASGYLIDPHTACGVHAARVALDGLVGDATARVVLATAHPAKFPDAMQEITGTRPGLPARLSSLMSDPERYPIIGNDLKEIEAFVESVSRAAGAPA